MSEICRQIDERSELEGGRVRFFMKKTSAEIRSRFGLEILPKQKENVTE